MDEFFDAMIYVSIGGEMRGTLAEGLEQFSRKAGRVIICIAERVKHDVFTV